MRNAFLVIFVTLISLFASACNDPISGGACDPIGSTKTVNGQLWTCAKNVETGRGYWYKGKP